MAKFKVRLSQLDAGEQSVEFPISHEWLNEVLDGTDIRATENADAGQLSLRLYQSGPDIIVSGTASAHLVVSCSRCLEDIDLPVQAELSIVMSEPPEGMDPNAEIDVESEDLGREYFQGDELIFDDIVRDQLLLELPMQPRCTDPPCPEWVKQYLTTAEEAEQLEQKAKEKVDPRLAALQELSDKLKDPKN